MISTKVATVRGIAGGIWLSQVYSCRSVGHVFYNVDCDTARRKSWADADPITPHVPALVTAAGERAQPSGSKFLTGYRLSQAQSLPDAGLAMIVANFPKGTRRGPQCQSSQGEQYKL